jgi:hypothetical protein
MRLKNYSRLVAYKTLSIERGGRIRGKARMSIGWITIAVIALGISWLVTFALLKMADDNDRAARHAERKLIPFSDVTVTQAGYDE